jgi:hypothetical protein
MHWFKTQDGYVNLELVQQIEQRKGVPGRGGRADIEPGWILKFGQGWEVVIADPGDVKRLETLLKSMAG